MGAEGGLYPGVGDADLGGFDVDGGRLALLEVEPVDRGRGRGDDELLAALDRNGYFGRRAEGADPLHRYKEALVGVVLNRRRQAVRSARRHRDPGALTSGTLDEDLVPHQQIDGAGDGANVDVRRPGELVLRGELI